MLGLGCGSNRILGLNIIQRAQVEIRSTYNPSYPSFFLEIVPKRTQRLDVIFLHYKGKLKEKEN